MSWRKILGHLLDGGGKWQRRSMTHWLIRWVDWWFEWATCLTLGDSRKLFYFIPFLYSFFFLSKLHFYSNWSFALVFFFFRPKFSTSDCNLVSKNTSFCELVSVCSRPFQTNHANRCGLCFILYIKSYFRCFISCGSSLYSEALFTSKLKHPHHSL